MFDRTLPILLLGVVFHEARYVEAVDELQLWRWASDAHRDGTSRRLPGGDLLHHDAHGVLVGVSVRDAARRARSRAAVRLDDRHALPPAVLRDLIATATVVGEEHARPLVADDAARELRGLLDAIGDLVAGASDELTAGELTDLHDRLLLAVAEWADPLGIQPLDPHDGAAVSAADAADSARELLGDEDDDDTRTTTRAVLEAWADGRRDAHDLARPPICATDAQLLALLHHARRAGLGPDAAIHVARRRGRVEARLRGKGTVALDAAGHAASSSS